MGEFAQSPSNSSDTPPFDESIALSSQICGFHQLQSDKQLVNVPQNDILRWGALSILVDDEANVTTGKRIICITVIHNAMDTSFVNNGKSKLNKELHPHSKIWMSIVIGERGENQSNELAIAYCANSERAIFGIPQEDKKVIYARFKKVLHDHKYQIGKHSLQLELWYSLSKDGDKGNVAYKEVNGYMEKDKDNSIV